MKTKQPLILLAIDDLYVRLFTEAILQESGLLYKLSLVEDSKELRTYIRRDDKYGDPRVSPRPHLLLMDLAMVRDDGWVILWEVESTFNWQQIPIVLLDTITRGDIQIPCYDPPENSLTELTTFGSLVEVIKKMDVYRDGMTR